MQNQIKYLVEKKRKKLLRQIISLQFDRWWNESLKSIYSHFNYYWVKRGMQWPVTDWFKVVYELCYFDMEHSKLIIFKVWDYLSSFFIKCIM